MTKDGLLLIYYLDGLETDTSITLLEQVLLISLLLAIHPKDLIILLTYQYWEPHNGTTKEMFGCPLEIIKTSVMMELTEHGIPMVEL